jgi:hypothetical protein
MMIRWTSEAILLATAIACGIERGSVGSGSCASPFPMWTRRHCNESVGI